MFSPQTSDKFDQRVNLLVAQRIPHADITLERPTLCPPPWRILNNTPSASFAMALQLVKSAGFGSSP
jgi:hypothetical protein